MKHFLINNIGLKILSVVVAALLWVIIINITDPIITEVFDDIPVKIINGETFTSKGYQYNVQSGDEIDVEVKGKRSVVSNMKESGFIAIADLSQLSSKSKLYMAQVSVTYPTLDPNEAIEITPKTDMLTIELEDSEMVPFNVRIVQTGSVGKGYSVISTTLSTNVIQVTASKTQVSKIKELVIEVNVDQKKESFEIEASPIAYDFDGNVIDSMKVSYNQDLIGVSVLIYPQKEIMLEVITRGQPEYGYEVTNVEFAPSTIVVAGKEEDLNQIGRLIIPYDVTGAKESIDSQVNLEAALKDAYGDKYILVDETQTAGLIVTIEALDTKTIYLQEKDIELRNLPENLECTFNILPIAMKIMGNKEDLSNITAQDLNPHINFEGSTAGTYTADIRTRYIKGILVNTGTASVILSEKIPEEETGE